MSNTRGSISTTEKLPDRQLRDTASSVNAIAWPANQMTKIATDSLTATCALWSELIDNQQRFTVRLVNAMRVPTRVPSQLPQLAAPSLVDSRGDEGDNRAIDGNLPALAFGSRRRRAPSNAPAESEFPIKRYDSLTVEQIVAKLAKIRDRRSLRTVLAYEAKHKARKGVASAGEARLRNLLDS